MSDDEYKYSTNDLVMLLGCVRYAIYNARTELNLKCKRFLYKGAKMAYYTEASKDLIAKYISFNNVQERNAWVQEYKNSLAQVDNEHVLVKDRRFLELNFWPDIVPVCFKDMEA